MSHNIRHIVLTEGSDIIQIVLIILTVTRAVRLVFVIDGIDIIVVIRISILFHIAVALTTTTVRFMVDVRVLTEGSYVVVIPVFLICLIAFGSVSIDITICSLSTMTSVIFCAVIAHPEVMIFNHITVFKGVNRIDSVFRVVIAICVFGIVVATAIRTIIMSATHTGGLIGYVLFIVIVPYHLCTGRKCNCICILAGFFIVTELISSILISIALIFSFEPIFSISYLVSALFGIGYSAYILISIIRCVRVCIKIGIRSAKITVYPTGNILLTEITLCVSEIKT